LENEHGVAEAVEPVEHVDEFVASQGHRCLCDTPRDRQGRASTSANVSRVIDEATAQASP
jgi:hypothetical protein